MKKKLLDVSKIILYFNTKCSKCGTDNEYLKTGVDVTEILFTGTPICATCGEDLELKDKCGIDIDAFCIENNTSVF
jgi:DNA-directed RNA polymerase subunit RPC12/RpoP